MRNLHFENSQQFEDLFTKRSIIITDAIVRAIEKAIVDKKDSAKVFSLTFQDYEDAYEITLPKASWRESLESCLDFYHKNNLQDQQIDTWKLLELVKVL